MTRGCESWIKRCAGLQPPTCLLLRWLRMDSFMKCTRANTLPKWIRFTVSFGEVSISRSSLWDFFLVASSSGHFASLDRSSDYSHLRATLPQLQGGSRLLLPPHKPCVTLATHVSGARCRWSLDKSHRWIHTNPRGYEYVLPNTPSLSDRKTVHGRKPGFGMVTGDKTCRNR